MTVVTWGCSKGSTRSDGGRVVDEEPAAETVPARPPSHPGKGSPSCPSWAQIDPADLQPLPPGPQVAAFDAAWELVRTRHHDPTVGCLDWKTIRTEQGAKVAAARDVTAAYVAINEALALLGESHLLAWPPATAAARETGLPPPTVPLGQPVARVPVVGAGARLHGAWARELGVAGWMLTAIDDVAVSELQRVEQERTGQGRAGTALRRAVDRGLRCGVGQTRTLEVRREPSSSRRLAAPCSRRRAPTLSFGHLREVDATVEGFMVPDTTVGVVRFGAWMVPMVSQIAAAVESVRSAGARQLLFDLRGNPGGVGVMAIPVARLVLREPTSLGALRLRVLRLLLPLELLPVQLRQGASGSVGRAKWRRGGRCARTSSW